MLLFSECHIAYNVASSCHVTHIFTEQTKSCMLMLALYLVPDLPQAIVQCQPKADVWIFMQLISVRQKKIKSPKASKLY